MKEDQTSSAQDFSIPLLRQIETLQAQSQVSRRDWEEVETSLTFQLHEAQSEKLKAFLVKETATKQVEGLVRKFFFSEFWLKKKQYS